MKAKLAKHFSPSPHALNRFIAVPENCSVLRAIRRLAAFELRPLPRSRTFPLLLLHGQPGTGKSHLVNGLLERIIADQGDRSVQIIPARDLGRLLTEPPSGTDPADEFRVCDVLIVEDVQHLPIHAADALASLLDHRQSRRQSIVVTASSGPAHLDHLPMRLRSRLASGLVVGLEPLSMASRREVARVLCEQRRLHITDEVLDWLARMPTGGVRPILGNLARLEHLSQLHPPPLNLATVTAQLPAEVETPILDRLADRVAERFGLKVKQLKGRDRHRHLLWPRQVGMYLARKQTKMPLVRIGAFFGGHDHSTVLHACRKVENTLVKDDVLRNDLTELTALIR